MDTIIGGKWLPDQDMAWKLCKTAVTRIHELENEIGCFFDRIQMVRSIKKPLPDRHLIAPRTKWI